MSDESDNAAERRVEERAPITLRVDYKRLNTFFADYTRNISKGGTFIRTETPLPIGTEFVFELVLPKANREEGATPIRLELTGRVKWIVSVPSATPTSPAGMGIQFVFRDDSQATEVEEIVENLMRESLGPILAERLLAKKTGSPE